MKISRQVLKKAHKACFQNRTILTQSKKCACFFCNNIFPFAEIENWCDDNTTALCPCCGVDSVIGDAAGYPDFILAMHRYWFGLNRPMGDGRKIFYIKIVIEE